RQLSRAVRRSGLSAHGGEHPALSAVRREPEIVVRAAAIGLFHAQGLVDQVPAAGLHAALGDASAVQLSVHQLDAERAMGADQQFDLAGGACGWAALARQSGLRVGFGHLWPYLEMAALLDPDLPRRAPGRSG